MLPSTGYFKAINCPFYHSGSCERPYCHFRHAKKDNQNINNGGVFNQLVPTAVKNVLQSSDNTNPTEDKGNLTGTNSRATYNPTPISELNKINNGEINSSYDIIEQKRRHIPIPYTPSKPMSMPTKRFIDNDSIKPFVYSPVTKYTPGSTDNVSVDPYLPKGSNGSTETYLPGSDKPIQEYTPSTDSVKTSSVGYIPSDKSDANKNKILEYRPSIVANKTDVPRLTYQPTPRAQVPCFSSDEDEPSPKKSKISADVNNFDGLEDEFNILDQILDEEKTDSGKLEKKDDLRESGKKSNNNEKNGRKHKTQREPSDSKKSDEKAHKDDGKSKSSDRKSTHKSSHKDKYKDKHKHNTDNKNSRRSSNSSKLNYSESDSRRHSSKDSKQPSKSSDRKDDRKKDKYKHKDHKHSKDRSSKRERSRDKNKDKKEQSSNKTENNSNNSDDQIDEDVVEMSESDEETIALECKKIFEEYIPTEKEISSKIIFSDDEDKADEPYIPSKKRISRTEGKVIKTIPRAPIKPDFKGNAAQTMAQRITKIREFHEARQTLTQPEVKTEIPKPVINIPPSSNKIRIAHVPYVSNMINAKKVIPVKPPVSLSDPSTSSTISHTVKKGTQRVAHIPSEKFIDRPGVLEPLASKIAANIRSIYLNMMIDECLKIYELPTDAYNRAQHEELSTSKKCSTIPIYKNSAVLAVSRLRKESAECNGIKKSAIECVRLQKSGGKLAPTWSIENKHKKNADNAHHFIGAQFYKNISKWVLSEEQLQENGFPRVHPSGEKGKAKIYVENKRQRPPKGFIRVCSRCKNDYIVNKKGFPEVKEECVYHPNNKYRFRGEVRYQCCSQDGSSEGCCIAPVHVYEYVDYENLKGYVRTLPPEKPLEDYGVYALDCEMCYTTHGLDLTRVTVINSSCKTVYETLIKPLHPIIDYNTRYSGITEEHMADVKTTLIEVQATLLSMFSNKTILVGHSLESDFKALKLIHDTVIDTSVLFPHKMGLPYKRALRNLSSEYLRKIIQNSVDGHDSAEDATVCMELIIHKLREDLKTR